MAPKDYVARGRNKKPAPPPPKPSLPWLRILVTLILLALFGYFLWSIKGKAPEPTPNIETNVKAQTSDDTEAMPEIPDEEWEFITTLPEFTVEIEQQEQQKSGVRYLMQCGSFRLKEQAQELRANIAFQGLEAQVKSSTGTSGLWYRVILGPYERKRHAEKDRHTLQRAKINGCKIWNWNLN